MPKNDEQLVLFCTDHCEALVLDPIFWEEDHLLCFSMYTLASATHWSWRGRLAHIWRIITRGHPWTDELILTRERVWQLYWALGKLLNAES